MTPAKMTMLKVILGERPAPKEKMPTQLFYSNRDLGRALRAIGIMVVIAFVLSSAVFGANPAEELAKAGSTGGLDPKGNSWVSIQQSVEQFGHP
jgi:hypothetical protein